MGIKTSCEICWPAEGLFTGNDILQSSQSHHADTPAGILAGTLAGTVVGILVGILVGMPGFRAPGAVYAELGLHGWAALGLGEFPEAVGLDERRGVVGFDEIGKLAAVVCGLVGGNVGARRLLCSFLW